MSLPGESSAVVGSLEARSCWTVLDRQAGRTRIWVAPAQGFQGEVEVSDRALAWILVDDVPLRLEPADEPAGEVLSGAVVAIEKELGGDFVIARVLEGRVGARFLVNSDDLFHATSWPQPEVGVEPDAGWPVASLPLPPAEATIARTPGGRDALARIRPPLFHLDDVLLDPAQGIARVEYLERAEHEARVRIVAPHLWVEGWVTDLDWRDVPPVAGWDPAAGAAAPRIRSSGGRQMGSKAGELSLEAKGEPAGQVQPGTWVLAGEESGGWLQVTVPFEGGLAAGWIEKKRLQVEKKQDPVPESRVGRVAMVTVGNTAVQWATKDGHEGEPELAADLVRGLAVSRIDELRLGYARALALEPDKKGEVVVRVVVDKDGIVLERSVAVDRLSCDQVTAAMEPVLDAMSFPAREIPRKQAKLDHNLVVWLQYLFKPLGQ